MGDVEDATQASIAAATHLTDLDKGAVETLLVLARKIDTDDALRESYLDYQVDKERERKPLQMDNVSIPTYLKFCESLGLTPAGRAKQPSGKEAAGGKLAGLRAVHADEGKPKRRTA